jgi:Na+(H+)/acetate symporter ActP
VPATVGGSCDTRESTGYCIDFFGALYTFAAVQAACTAGVASADPCDRSDAYGQCCMNAGTDVAAATVYYDDTANKEQLKQICTTGWLDL